MERCYTHVSETMISIEAGENNVNIDTDAFGRG